VRLSGNHAALSHYDCPEASGFRLPDMRDKNRAEFAVQFEDGHIEVCADEAIARALADRLGGTLLKRKVNETSWTKAAQRPSNDP
jgi:hypothetical protein